MEAIKKAKEIEKDWRHFSLPDQYLEKFVFENLLDKPASSYDLKALFSNDAIKAILKLGEKIINADNQGKSLVTVGSDGMQERTAVSNKYKKIFSDWERAGWISRKKISDSEIEIKLIESLGS